MTYEVLFKLVLSFQQLQLDQRLAVLQLVSSTFRNPGAGPQLLLPLRDLLLLAVAALSPARDI